MAKVAIITRPQPGSPRVLGECLNEAIKTTGHRSEVFFQLNAVKRLLSFEETDKKYSWFLWNAYRLFYFFKDRRFFNSLKAFDVVIISDCIPIGFYKQSYSIEKLKKRLKNIPVLIYEVYFLGNAPTVLKELQDQQHPTIERYDWHLAVSEVTEIRQQPAPPWSQVGLYLKSTGLKPTIKKNLLAVVDFAREGHEDFRNTQIRVLKDLNIPFISLERRYTIGEIRAIYQQATFYFMQSLEAFGVPIAECLACGSYIFTPSSSWPMSWRLDAHPEVYGPGALSECFVVYDSPETLKLKLMSLKADYHLEKTPQKVFNLFLADYPTFYEGNQEVLNKVLTSMEENTLLASPRLV